MTDKPDLKVVNFPAGSLANIPETLRKLADAIEEGNFGIAQACVVVLEADLQFEVFGLGCEADGTEAHYLLACAQRKIENAFLSAKEE